MKVRAKSLLKDAIRKFAQEVKTQVVNIPEVETSGELYKLCVLMSTICYDLNPCCPQTDDSEEEEEDETITNPLEFSRKAREQMNKTGPCSNNNEIETTVKSFFDMKFDPV